MSDVSYRELFGAFWRIGWFSFGGPAAQIALMQKEIVEDRRWLDEHAFLSALSFCMLLPGPEAMQLATYVGWKLRGVKGGLIAGGLFVIPGALVILGLSVVYAYVGQLPVVAALFTGVKAAVIVIVVQSLWRIARRAFSTRAELGIAGLSFIAIFSLGLPFPLIVAAAALFGYITAQPSDAEVRHTRISLEWRTALAIGSLWWSPVALAWSLGSTFLADLGLFFSKLAVVTFGGAYAVLAYMTQAIVADKGWLTTAQMVDGLGLAETTPGPLILVTEFAGFQAGFAQGGLDLALVAAAMTLWVTFTPCFLWIFVGAPYVNELTRWPRLASALRAITAAVVGVIANLSIWFALHVFFGAVRETRIGVFELPVPQVATIDLAAIGLSCLAAYLLLRLRLGVGLVIVFMALAGAGASAL